MVLFIGRERIGMSIIEAEAMVMPFGAHKDKTLARIAAEDVSYFDYLLTIEGLEIFLGDAIRTVAEKHGRKRKQGSAATGGAKQMSLF